MYHRIYNKKLLSKNGTLIDNWYEEEQLRNITGVPRAVQQKNFPKKFFDFENPIRNPNPYDDTFKRVINPSQDSQYKTTYSTYGDFSFPEKKYKYEGEESKEFNTFISEKVELEHEKSNFKEPISSFDAYTKNTIIPQKLEGPYGQRLMKTQDLEKIPEYRKDTVFQSEFGINEKPGIITREEFSKAFKTKIPYYKDKPLSYWAMNQNRSNVYHSAPVGINSFAKNSGFTQTIHNTKASKGFYQNVTTNKKAEEIFLDKKDDEFIKDYQDYQEYVNEKEVNSIEKCYEKGNMEVCKRYLDQIKNKILKEIREKGWTGLRKLKLYLKGIQNNPLHAKYDLIEKTEFKFHVYRWGITSLKDNEVDLIFKMFGKNCNNTINFIEFLNYLHDNSPKRKDMIEKLVEIFKRNPNDEYIHFSDICKYMNMNYHPEALKLRKDHAKIEKEFVQSWGYLKEDDLISLNNFVEFFEDISTCFEDEGEFEKCMYAISYSYLTK